MAKTAPDARRDLFRSSLDVLVLSILADGPIHGYAIRQQLQYTLGQSLPIASLYPLLHRLEQTHLITASSNTHNGRERKIYQLTPDGRTQLRRAAAEWQAMIARLQSVVLPAVRRVAGKK